MMHRFLVATDGSPAAEAAVAAAVELAAEEGAEIVFLHVVEAVDVIAPPFGPLMATAHELAVAQNDPALVHAAEVADAHDVACSLRLVSGFDIETILATADEIDAALIAIGSNRHGPLGTAFFGSVSKELLRRARRPLLVVHPTPARLYARVGA